MGTSTFQSHLVPYRSPSSQIQTTQPLLLISILQNTTEQNHYSLVVRVKNTLQAATPENLQMDDLGDSGS